MAGRGAIKADQPLGDIAGKETPHIDNEIPVQALARQPVLKIILVLINAEYVCPLNVPPHHMIQSPGASNQCNLG